MIGQNPNPKLHLGSLNSFTGGKTVLNGGHIQFPLKGTPAVKPTDESVQRSSLVPHVVPLMLREFSLLFLSYRNLVEWTSALNKLKRIPKKETMGMLKISYSRDGNYVFNSRNGKIYCH